MKLKLIACNVFMREACHCIARSPHIIDVEFTELGDHVRPETLRAGLQARVDAAEASAKDYDAILLLFGICGNSTIGLTARKTRVVIPRAHDCCSILLGSKERFREHFADNPSMPFSSAGYIERGEYYLRVEEGENRVHYGDAYAEYVKQYGEENAKFIWESMHPEHPELGNKAVFIDLPETAALGYADRFREKAEADGKQVVRLEGSLRIIHDLIFGQWDPETFLTLNPGQKAAGVYDWAEIVRAETA